MEKLLKEWRQDAINKHQYESAIYIGDKLLALTNDPKDAFWLAQVHFSTGNYTRAQSFLTKHNLVEHGPSCRYLAAHCNIKQYKFDEALMILSDKNPTHLISTSSKARRKLQHTSGTLRNGVAKVKAAGRLDRIERSEERDREDASDLKFEAAMCYLRGICFAKQNAFDRAKECYKDAVRIDVQCFEAFDQLMKNSLMSPDEEWTFLESLDFDSISADDPSTSQEAAQFAKMLYTTRLSKYKNPTEFTNATETLSTHYHLAQNPDLLLAKADLLFTQCRFKEALAITSSILETDEYNFAIYPLHLACLHELAQTNTLFLLSHRLADHHPDEPATWLAVGVYYLSINKVAEARRFFSKASMMDPHFGPAWIGFAHTFAAEGEHDQAISAYSTAARLFQGTHLPQLFLGMQNLQLNNLTLAQEYLNAAHGLCQTDPLLLNELGVVFYHIDHLPAAVQMFTRALQIARDIDSDPRAWISTRANLGHAYRRQNQWNLALGEFEEVLRQGGKDAGIFCAKGLVLLEMGRSWEAVIALHEALGVSPQDPVATDLLGRALEENSRLGDGPGDVLVGGMEMVGLGGLGGSFGLETTVEEEFEGVLRRRKESARRVVEERRRAREREREMDGRRGLGMGRERGSLMGLGEAGESMLEESMMEVSEGDE
ncbi:anaphase promoting complex subunit cdc16 [Trapelia coarctata]|nr:anaphase promoting complex subunit cdc16 [Trapelia coarctata]